MTSALQSSIGKYGAATLVFLFIVICFVGCSPESFEPEPSIGKIESKYITADEFKTHRKEFGRFQEVKDNISFKAVGTTGRMVYDSIYRFEIDIDNILYIRAGNYRYYTFAINRENSRKIENLVLTFNDRDQYRLAIIKYDFSDEELAELAHGGSFDLTGRAEVEILNQTDGAPCYDIIRVRSFTRIPGQIEFSEIIIVEIPCPPDSGNTGPGGGSNSGGSNSGSSGWSYGGPAIGWPVSYGPPGNPGPGFGGSGHGGEISVGPSELTPNDNSLLTAPVLPTLNAGLRNAQKIVREIDDTELDDCSKAVLNQLKNLTEMGMAKIIVKFDFAPSVYNLTIKTKDTIIGNNFSAGITFRTPPSNQPYNYTIYMRPSYLLSNNKLARASIILHEFIHVYFLSLSDDQSNGNPNAFNDFPQLFELFVAKRFGPEFASSNFHHQIMAVEYIDILGRALQEFDTGIPVPVNEQPLQPYTDLAWAGLGDAPIFETTDLLNDDDRERIRARYATEMVNASYGGQTPIGQSCE